MGLELHLISRVQARPHEKPVRVHPTAGMAHWAAWEKCPPGQTPMYFAVLDIGF